MCILNLGPELILSIIGLILTILVIIYNSRPKMLREVLLFSYIDDENHQKIEQRELEISWGYLFFCNSLKLVEIPKSSYYELTFKPVNGLENPLPNDCYQDKTGKIGRVIYLTNRKFFSGRKVNKVFLFLKSPLSLDYREKITATVYPTCLRIINENPIEIRNANIQLPANLDLNKIVNALQHIDHVRIEIPLPLLGQALTKKFSECREAQLAVTMIIKKLQPKQGNTPGVIEIPLS
jgi:hypothetical protein